MSLVPSIMYEASTCEFQEVRWNQGRLVVLEGTSQKIDKSRNMGFLKKPTKYDILLYSF